MSIPIPLAATLITGRGSKRVTGQLRDLSFRDTAPGGFASAALSLDRPLTVQPDEIAYYGRLIISDTRHGGTVWEGRLEDPGRGAGADGQVWDLTAMGPAAHASDRTVPLIYIDRSQERWVRAEYSTQGADTQSTERGVAIPALRTMLQEGSTATTSWVASWIYRAISEAGMKLARVFTETDAGISSANWEQRVHTRTGSGASPGVAASAAWSTTSGSLAANVGGSNFSDGHDVVDLRSVRLVSSTTSASDTVWAEFFGIIIRAMLKDATGADITTGYSGVDYVLASDVVKDLLGRLLSQFDGTLASVATTSHQIEQLAYPDGVTPAQVLDDMMMLEPAYYWAAWEQTVNAKYRFEWTAWPTSIRYEADATDGFDSPGSADGLYDAVSVRWRDYRGYIRRTRRTQTVTVLSDAGITREAFVDLGDEVAGQATAERAGDQFLADHATPPNAGRLTVARPIRDLIAGRWVMPWEIRSGNLIRVRGVLPRTDALNATARDGVTVFRVRSKEYRTSSASADLELDAYSRSTARALAEVQRRAQARRR